MAGMLRKLASAFVVLDDGRAAGKGQTGLDEMMKDTPDLLAQLEGTPADAQSATSGASGGQSAVTMTADDVFQAASLPDGPNAAPRLLKLIAGLSMFPREQQLTMVRAMDAADDSWAEADVRHDAQARHAVLQRHLLAMVAEREAGVSAIDGEIERTEQSGKAVLEAIDAEIAALYARREKEAAETSTTLAGLGAQKQELFRQHERARLSIENVLQALVGLIGFFGGPPPPPFSPKRGS